MTAWDPASWPRRGSCGACGRLAWEAPSRRWWHSGRPCAARTQSIWRIDDIDIRNAVRFIPDGEPLPEAPARRRDFGHLNETVREFLARQAEETS